MDDNKIFKKPSWSKCLLLYSDAFIRSANRSRRIIIIIVFASIITFIASWNSRGGSWIKSRINRVNIALNHNAHLLVAPNRQQILINTKDSTLVEFEALYGLSLSKLEIHEITLNEEYIHFLPLSLGSLKDSIPEIKMSETLKDTLSPDRQFILSKSKSKLDTLANALYLCKYRNLNTFKKIKHQWEKWLEIRNDRVTVIPIPVFGILIDINDLELLGGFTFAVLMLWLRFSLSKEYGNLKIVFEEALRGKNANKKLGFTYYYLAMQQVLTTPKLKPSISLQKLRQFWRIVIKILFALPLIVHFLVWKYDLESVAIGIKTNYYRSVFNTVAGSFFLAAIILLTVLCILISIRIDEVWDKMANRSEIE